MKRSPKAKRRSAADRCPRLLKRIEDWIKRYAADLDAELRRHHAYNLYLTVLGFRPAFLAAGGFDAKKFARDFGVAAKVGPYFDIVGRDHAYLIHPKHLKKLEPLFRELERSYSDDEKVLEQRYEERVLLIGAILGFDDCLGDPVGPNTYGIFFIVAPKKRMTEKTEVFSYLCSRKNIQAALESALTLITEAKKYFSPCGLAIGFEVIYPYNPE